MLLSFASLTFLLVSGTSASPTPLSKRAALDDFIAAERPIALAGVLANVGPDGAQATNASRGVIIAGPGVVNPDYRYSWTRDSAMTMHAINEEFFVGNAALERTIQDYIFAEANRQTSYNPMGPLYPWGTGLGEPKYQINLTRFTGVWGRPQRDGPALRAITLMEYINYLIQNRQIETARDVVWPIVANDLAYTAQYWNETGYDLWEEVAGSSFFTVVSQHRALVQGHHIAHRLGVSCEGCVNEAPQIACFLQSFWDEAAGFIRADINGGESRSGINADPILGAMEIFDINGSCENRSYQPCSSRILATHKAYVDAFRSIYPINAGIAANAAVATGRYPEDTYYGGHPWYITTLAAAELLYDAAAQFRQQGKLTVDSTSLEFFQQFYPAAQVGTLMLASNEFTDVLSAMTTYADGFVEVVRTYTPANGSYSEQFSRDTGEQLSAYDLTWSFAAFLTMSQRRAGQFPPSWRSRLNLGFAPVCEGTSTRGTYAPAIAAGAPAVDTSCTVQVTFVVNASTTFGQNIYITGNTSALGNMAPDFEPMVPPNYPLWYSIVDLEPETTYLYKYVHQNSDNYALECANRTITTPACGDGFVQISTSDSFGETCEVITENFCNPDVVHCW